METVSLIAQIAIVIMGICFCVSAVFRCKYFGKAVNRYNILFYIVSLQAFVFIKHRQEKMLLERKNFMIKTNLFLRLFYLLLIGIFVFLAVSVWIDSMQT